MRNDILQGALKPGQRLKFPNLCVRYEASVGAIREALAALANQGLVRTVAHRGFTVTPISMDDLKALETARCLIEPQVVAMSVRNGNVEWEAQVIAAHHVLERTLPKRGGSNEPDSGWVDAHEAFHQALFSACGNQRLLGIVRRLSADATLYRRWSDMIDDGSRDVAAEHRALVEAAVTGDADLTADLLRRHIQRTVHDIMASQRPFGSLND